MKQVYIILLRTVTIFSVLFGFFLSAGLDAYAGNDITVRKRKMTIRDIASAVKETSGQPVLYDADMIDESSFIQVTEGTFSVETFLTDIFKGSDYSIRKINNSWQLTRNYNGKLPSVVTGRILYQDGEPLYGATVMIPGTDNGTISNEHGKYRLQVPEGCGLIQVAFMGMNDRIVQITPEDPQADITMNETATALDEVVFVGYSTMSKRDVLGSISSLRAEEMRTNSSSGDILSAMKGKIAGLNIVANSGEPGAGSQVTLRGAASLTGSGEPLYIIDGVPIEVENEASLSGDASFSPLANINLDDVESIEVLKDAASAAIYGSRAANGVIIITTKGGGLGEMKPTLSFSHTSTLATLARKIDAMTSDEFRAAYIDARMNYNGQYPTNDWVINPTHPYHAQSIDWQDVIFRPAYQTKNNLSIMGASPNFSYNISLRYSNQKPIVIATNYEQYNINGKFTYRITPWLKGGSNIYYTNTDYNRIISTAGNNQSALRAALVSNPCLSPYDPITGELLDWLGTSGQGGRNPVALAEKTPFIYDTEWVLMSQWLEFTLAKGLTFRINASLDKTESSQDYYIPKELVSLSTAQQIDKRQYKESDTKNFVNENILNYSGKFRKHAVSATLGQSVQVYRRNEIQLFGEQYLDPEIIPIQSAKEQTRVMQTVEERRMLSFFGRINYNYDGRYLISAVLRSDGSSRFGPENRFGFFPSASIGWRFSAEPFMKPLSPVLTDGKIRASYGVTGNQNVGNYAWRGIYQSNDDRYDGNVAIKHTSMQNTELGWERTTQINLGLDLNLWKDRLIMAVDLYKKVSDDLLFSFPLNSYTGFTSVSRNYGAIENKGIEININTINIARDKFSWRTDFNIAFNKNKIISLPNNTEFIVGNYSLGRVGEPAGVFYAHNALGIYAYTKDNIWYDADGSVREIRQGSVNGQPFQGGDVIWDDLDDNGVIDDNDRKIIGSPHPVFFGGFGNNFTYENFSLSVYFDYSYGNKIMNELRRNRNRMITTGNLGADALGRWRNEGDVTDFPRLIYADRMGNFRPSTLTMEDGSFLRLSNISFGYNFPQRMVSKLKIKSLRMYLSATNLLIWSNYSGYDPEISSSLNPFQKGIDNGSFPKNRTFNLGLDITF